MVNTYILYGVLFLESFNNIRTTHPVRKVHYTASLALALALSVPEARDVPPGANLGYRLLQLVQFFSGRFDNLGARSQRHLQAEGKETSLY